MTTSQSPKTVLRKQATQIVARLKAPNARRLSKRPEALDVKFGIVQDDKIIGITLTWLLIETTSADKLIEMIYHYMAGQTTQ